MPIQVIIHFKFFENDFDVFLFISVLQINGKVKKQKRLFSNLDDTDCGTSCRHVCRRPSQSHIVDAHGKATSDDGMDEERGGQSDDEKGGEPGFVRGLERP